MVLAGPGCGKTHILALRVFEALQHGILPSKMLCVTFTNRAAREMEQRIRKYMGYVPHDLMAGNMHRFCMRFLFANNLVPDDTWVCDEDDQETFFRETFPERRIDAKLIVELAGAMGRREAGITDPLTDKLEARLDINTAPYVDAYISFKRETHLIDYNDMLLLAYKALRNTPELCTEMRDYEWVQVDEVQDMTPLQLAIVDMVSPSPHRCVIYLGDEQQAIFRFAGAGGRALEKLKQTCRGKILRLRRNFRSPQQLVAMCNGIASRWLDIPEEFLPKSEETEMVEGRLQLAYTQRHNVDSYAGGVAKLLMERHPDDTVAILTRTNAEAGKLSEIFDRRGLRHFLVSQRDTFHSVAFKTVVSHFTVLTRPDCRTAWERLLYQTGACHTLTLARELTSLMAEVGIGVDELLTFGKGLRIERFCRIMEDANSEIVVFDTETTGLDVFADDIVQIAAVRLRGGKITGERFDVFIQSERPLPKFLGNGVHNPLASVYPAAEKLASDEAFRRFAEFVGDRAVLCGHNIDFDLAILERNLLRCPAGQSLLWLLDRATALDTLALSRQVRPELHRHTLEAMCSHYGIGASGFHNAMADAELTARLLGYLYTDTLVLLPHALTFAESTAKTSRHFAMRYGELYEATKRQLAEPTGSLADAVAQAAGYFTAGRMTKPVKYLDYIMRLIGRITSDDEATPCLRNELAAHLPDLMSFNEADLYLNGIVDRRLTIMTVHKAKGLEFDHVHLYNVCRNFSTSTDEARVLYVACSRARQTLSVSACGKVPAVIADSLPHFRLVTPYEVELTANLFNRKA